MAEVIKKTDGKEKKRKLVKKEQGGWAKEGENTIIPNDSKFFQLTN